MRTLFCILLSVVAISVTSCTKYSDYPGTASSAKTYTTLILDGQEIEPQEYISWKCREYPRGNRILFEVGVLSRKARLKDYLNDGEHEKLSDKEKEALAEVTQALNNLQTLLGGFILFDGTNEGEKTIYSREGLNHRWDWGSELKYSFIVKPDGTGLYVDFRTAEGGSKRPDDIYQCSR